MEDIILLKFYAEWCGPCKMITPALNALLSEGYVYEVHEVDIDSEKGQKLSKEYNVRGVPTIIKVGKNSRKERSRIVGARDKQQLKEFLDG